MNKTIKFQSLSLFAVRSLILVTLNVWPSWATINHCHTTVTLEFDENISHQPRYGQSPIVVGCCHLDNQLTENKYMNNQ